MTNTRRDTSVDDTFVLPKNINTDGSVTITRLELVKQMRLLDKAMNADSGDAEADALGEIRDWLSEQFEEARSE